MVRQSKGRSVAKLIQEAREKRGWSQAELARQLECTRAMISIIESGAIKPREPSIMDRACELLGIETG